MSKQIEQSRERLKAGIKAAEVHLKDAGSHVESAVENGIEKLDQQRTKALAKCDASRAKAEEAGVRMKQYLAEATDQAIAKFEDWKTDRDIKKIEKHADSAEQQAVDALELAAFAIIEAEVAVVEALRARKLAIEVAG